MWTTCFASHHWEVCQSWIHAFQLADWCICGILTRIFHYNSPWSPLRNAATWCEWSLSCLVSVSVIFLVANFEKMFHQVLLSPSDFSWLSVFSGANQALQSPSVCSHALKQAAKDSDDSQNLLMQITRRFYIDHWLDSFPTTLKVILTAHCLTDL